MIELNVGAEWCSGPVMEARTFSERMKGLRPRPSGRAMAFRAVSLHGFGMREPLKVLCIGKDDVVRSVRTLRPRRILLDREAKLMVEFPVERELPQPGSRVSIVDTCLDP